VERDIDRVIELVRNRLPAVSVVQWHKVHPADDDGIWWFRLPGVEKDIQLESSYGTCPFMVEHDDTPSAAEAEWAGSIDRAADAVVKYLQAQLALQAGDGKAGTTEPVT